MAEPATGDWRVPVGPWFRARPSLAVVVAILMFMCIGAAGLASLDWRDATMAALVLPVALLAVTFGREGGVGGALGVVAVLVTWEAVHADVTGAMWAAAVAIIVLGMLLGTAVDRLLSTERAVRAADAQRWRAERASQRLHEAAAINDTMVQSVAVAKWALEAGDTGRAVEVLDRAVDEGQRLVSGLLRDAGRDPDAYEVGNMPVPAADGSPPPRPGGGAVPTQP
ncbi:MAG TPA: hypothetical protein VMU14_10755 [Acidimicrobiales bacterium]|nr:hypothetical protein [Acidimicrobiales bacterium]